jgi:hypothetical protein
MGRIVRLVPSVGDARKGGNGMTLQVNGAEPREPSALHAAARLV